MRRGKVHLADLLHLLPAPQGLDLPAILGLQAFNTLACVVLEIPLGLVADRFFGRRTALVWSAGSMGAGCAVIVADSSLGAFHLVELCFADSLFRRRPA